MPRKTTRTKKPTAEKKAPARPPKKVEPVKVDTSYRSQWEYRAATSDIVFGEAYQKEGNAHEARACYARAARRLRGLEVNADEVANMIAECDRRRKDLV
jgi:hypothetical protein